jgi:hypothetical protein
MKKETRVTDGATLRRSRLMGMFRFIADSEGATTKAIQSFMLMNYGLKFKTTSDYIHEASLAASLVLTQNGEWIIAKAFKKYLE